MSYLFDKSRFDRPQQGGQNQRGGTVRPGERKDEEEENSEGATG